MNSSNYQSQLYTTVYHIVCSIACTRVSTTTTTVYCIVTTVYSKLYCISVRSEPHENKNMHLAKVH